VALRATLERPVRRRNSFLTTVAAVAFPARRRSPLVSGVRRIGAARAPGWARRRSASV